MSRRMVVLVKRAERVADLLLSGCSRPLPANDILPQRVCQLHCVNINAAIWALCRTSGEHWLLVQCYRSRYVRRSTLSVADGNSAVYCAWAHIVDLADRRHGFLDRA